MVTFVRVASARDLPPGEGRVVVVQGHPVALFNVDGRFYAVSNVCLHRGGPIGEGMLDDAVVTCPNHGWEYDVRTGTNLANPDRKSTRLNSSHLVISYAVFCLKKKK